VTVVKSVAKPAAYWPDCALNQSMISLPVAFHTP
jgi:hypothetical protein